MPSAFVCAEPDPQHPVFWAYTFAGLALSTGAVALVDHHSDSALALSAANITAFAVLWVAKFFLLDQVFIVDDSDVGDDADNTSSAGAGN